MNFKADPLASLSSSQSSVCRARMCAEGNAALELAWSRWTLCGCENHVSCKPSCRFVVLAISFVPCHPVPLDVVSWGLSHLPCPTRSSSFWRASTDDNFLVLHLPALTILCTFSCSCRSLLTLFLVRRVAVCSSRCPSALLLLKQALSW